MIQDNQGAQAQVPGLPPGLRALPPVPVPGGDVAQGSFGPMPLAKKTKKGLLKRSMSYSPSSHGRAQALANEAAAPLLQYETKGPTGGGAASANPMVGFAVERNFSEVRIDLLEAHQRLNEYESLIQNEAVQLNRRSLEQQASEHEIVQLRAQLRQQAELTHAQLENRQLENTAEHHVLQQASSLAKVEFQSAVANEQGRSNRTNAGGCKQRTSE